MHHWKLNEKILHFSLIHKAVMNAFWQYRNMVFHSVLLSKKHIPIKTVKSIYTKLYYKISSVQNTNNLCAFHLKQTWITFCLLKTLSFSNKSVLQIIKTEGPFKCYLSCTSSKCNSFQRLWTLLNFQPIINICCLHRLFLFQSIRTSKRNQPNNPSCNIR